MDKIKALIRDVPNFPKEGIVFKDITPLLGHPEAFAETIDLLASKISPERPDVIVAVESRGFIFGAPLAYKLRCGFVPVRKKGKLPYKTQQVEYELEYGVDILEIHEDAFPKGAKVVIVDDLLATGGTSLAVIELVKRLGGEISSLLFLVELSFLNGRERLKDYTVHSLVVY